MTEKNPWVSAILNFFIWGAGYIYNGSRAACMPHMRENGAHRRLHCNGKKTIVTACMHACIWCSGRDLNTRNHLATEILRSKIRLASHIVSWT